MVGVDYVRQVTRVARFRMVCRRPPVGSKRSLGPARPLQVACGMWSAALASPQRSSGRSLPSVPSRPPNRPTASAWRDWSRVGPSQCLPVICVWLGTRSDRDGRARVGKRVRETPGLEEGWRRLGNRRRRGSKSQWEERTPRNLTSVPSSISHIRPTPPWPSADPGADAEDRSPVINCHLSRAVAKVAAGIGSMRKHLTAVAPETKGVTGRTCTRHVVTVS